MKRFYSVRTEFDGNNISLARPSEHYQADDRQIRGISVGAVRLIRSAAIRYSDL